MSNIHIKRFSWLDYARFIGIFLVLLGHTLVPTRLFDFVYLFHMPFFFIISGFLFSPAKYNSYWQFFKAKTKHLLVPYLFFSLLTFLFWYVIGRKFGDDAKLVFTWYDIISSFFASRMIIYNVALWFLPALFVTENVYYFVSKYIKPHYIFFLFIAIAWSYNYFIGINIPFHANIAIGYVVFYAFGALIRPLLSKIVECQKKMILNIALFISCVCIEVLILLMSEHLDMGMRGYKFFGLTVIAGIVGSVAILSAGILCDSLFGARKIVTFYATYTIVLYALHLQIMSIIKGITLYLFNIPLSVFNDALLSNFILIVVIFFVVYPFIIFFKTYTPSLIGK